MDKTSDGKWRARSSSTISVNSTTATIFRKMCWNICTRQSRDIRWSGRCKKFFSRFHHKFNLFSSLPVTTIPTIRRKSKTATKAVCPAHRSGPIPSSTSRRTLPPSSTRKATWWESAVTTPTIRRVSFSSSRALWWLGFPFVIKLRTYFRGSVLVNFRSASFCVGVNFRLELYRFRPIYRRLLWILYSSVREALMEDVLLHAARSTRHVSAQGWTRIPQESGETLTNISLKVELTNRFFLAALWQRSQCYSNTPRTGDQGQWLHQKAARLPAANVRSIGISFPDERLEGAAVVDWYNQFRLCLIFGAAAWR